eukprot:scaffold5866_cov93-Isochrysis_galbana.AAC.7
METRTQVDGLDLKVRGGAAQPHHVRLVRVGERARRRSHRQPRLDRLLHRERHQPIPEGDGAAAAVLQVQLALHMALPVVLLAEVDLEALGRDADGSHAPQAQHGARFVIRRRPAVVRCRHRRISWGDRRRQRRRCVADPRCKRSRGRVQDAGDASQRRRSRPRDVRGGRGSPQQGPPLWCVGSQLPSARSRPALRPNGAHERVEARGTLGRAPASRAAPLPDSQRHRQHQRAPARRAAARRAHGVSGQSVERRGCDLVLQKHGGHDGRRHWQAGKGGAAGRLGIHEGDADRLHHVGRTHVLHEDAGVRAGVPRQPREQRHLDAGLAAGRQRGDRGRHAHHANVLRHRGCDEHGHVTLGGWVGQPEYLHLCRGRMRIRGGRDRLATGGRVTLGALLHASELQLVHVEAERGAAGERAHDGQRVARDSGAIGGRGVGQHVQVAQVQRQSQSRGGRQRRGASLTDETGVCDARDRSSRWTVSSASSRPLLDTRDGARGDVRLARLALSAADAAAAAASEQAPMWTAAGAARDEPPVADAAQASRRKAAFPLASIGVASTDSSSVRCPPEVFCTKNQVEHGGVDGNAGCASGGSTRAARGASSSPGASRAVSVGKRNPTLGRRESKPPISGVDRAPSSPPPSSSGDGCGSSAPSSAAPDAASIASAPPCPSTSPTATTAPDRARHTSRDASPSMDESMDAVRSRFRTSATPPAPLQPPPAPSPPPAAPPLTPSEASTDGLPGDDPCVGN